MTELDTILINRAYEAFNAREIDNALATMDPDVHWPNGWEGGYVEGHAGVRDYWTGNGKKLVQPLNRFLLQKIKAIK